MYIKLPNGKVIGRFENKTWFKKAKPQGYHFFRKIPGWAFDLELLLELRPETLVVQEVEGDTYQLELDATTEYEVISYGEHRPQAVFPIQNWEKV